MKIVVVGLGAMGRTLSILAQRNGATLVGAVDPAYAGLPLSSVTALDEHKSIIVSDEINVSSRDCVALVATGTSLRAIYDTCLKCADAGLDVVTIAEDAFDPFFADADKALAEKLDLAFRKNGKTLIASGVQDGYFFQEPLALASSNIGFTHLEISNWADLGSLGLHAYEYLPIGKEPASLEVSHDDAAGQANRRLCLDVAARPLFRALGLEILSVKNHTEWVLAEEDIVIGDVEIDKGTIRGEKEVSIFSLHNGISAELSLISAFLQEGETTFNKILFSGVSHTSCITSPFNGDFITCSAALSRAFKVQSYPSGFIALDQVVNI